MNNWDAVKLENPARVASRQSVRFHLTKHQCGQTAVVQRGGLPYSARVQSFFVELPQGVTISVTIGRLVLLCGHGWVERLGGEISRP